MSILNLPGEGLHYFAGDSLDIVFQVQMSDGSPEDLTGAIVTWTVSVQERFGVLGATLVTLDNDLLGGVEILDPLTGGATVHLPIGALIVPGVHKHQLEVVLPTGPKSNTYADGSFIVEPSARPTT